MPRCSARGCRSVSKSGLNCRKMCYFPRDPERREAWRINCVKLGGKQDCWVPLDSSALCELHFDKDQWEKVRVDNKRKLKCNGIPTIFQTDRNKTTDLQVESVVENDQQESLADDQNCNENVHSLVITDESCANETVQSAFDVDHSYALNQNSKADDKVIQIHIGDVQNESRNSEDWFCKYKKLEKLYIKSERLKTIMKIKHKSTYGKLVREITMLKRRIKQLEEMHKNVTQLLHQDQLFILNNQLKKVPKWSNETLVRALQLKNACGVNGYKELLRQNFPLPSLRTLRNCKNEILKMDKVT